MRALQPRVLRRAAEILGGEDHLCLCLHIEPPALRMWIDDQAAAPARVVHQAIEIILKDDLVRAAQDRRKQPRDNGERASSDTDAPVTGQRP